jgi:hypothetical protein
MLYNSFLSNIELYFNTFKINYIYIFLFSLAPNTKDLDVFLRKQESGFGFRVLGGDGPDQSVSVHCGIVMVLELFVVWFGLVWLGLV